jgi:hypothetical protein
VQRFSIEHMNYEFLSIGGCGVDPCRRFINQADRAETLFGGDEVVREFSQTGNSIFERSIDAVMLDMLWPFPQ